MAERICDKRPCSTLAGVFPVLDLSVVDRQLSITASLSKLSAQVSLRVTLLYCPFCGMRLSEDIIGALSKAKGSL